MYKFKIMAMISTYQDYELTRSLMKLSQLYYETKREKETKERELKWKNERLKAISERMRQIISEDDEYKILKNNYLTQENNALVVNFVERMLDTKDDEKVMKLITETLTYLDSTYRKDYWAEQLDSGRFEVDEETEEMKRKLLITKPIENEEVRPSILTKEGIADFLKREKLVPGENLKSFEVDYDLEGRVSKLHIEILPRI